MTRTLAVVAGLVTAVGLGLGAQMRVAPRRRGTGPRRPRPGAAPSRQHRHLHERATAHPDDENNGLLVQLNRGQGYRTTLATATRGNGGQNEIGPEIFEALGVLADRGTCRAAPLRRRRAVLHARRRLRLFVQPRRDVREMGPRRDHRRLRPLDPDDSAGRHHGHERQRAPAEASTIKRPRSIAREAFKLAADPTKYPEQLKDGLRPWQPRSSTSIRLRAPPGTPERRHGLCRAQSVGVRSAARQDLRRDRHRGAQHAQVPGHGAAARAAWASRRRPISSPNRRSPVSCRRTRRRSSTASTRTIPGLAQFAGPRPPQELTTVWPRSPRPSRTRRSSSTAVPTRRRFSRSSTACARCALFEAGCVPAARTRAGATTSTCGCPEGTRVSAGDSPRQRRARRSAGRRRRWSCPGQPVKSRSLVANNGAADVTVKQVKFNGFDGDAPVRADGRDRRRRARRRPGGRGGAAAPPAPVISTLKKEMVARCDVGLKIPAGARVERAVLAPARRGGPLHVRRRRAVRPAVPADAVHRADDLRGWPARRPKKSSTRCPFSIATRATSSAARSGPSCSWSRRSRCACRPTSPSFPARSIGAASPVATATRGPSSGPIATGRELRVTVVNDAQGAAETVVTLQLPAGWTATPARQTMTFARQDESQTVRFSVKPAAEHGAWANITCARSCRRAARRSTAATRRSNIRTFAASTSTTTRMSR